MADVLGFFKKVMPFITTGLSLAGGPAGTAAAAILGGVLKVNNPTVDSITKTLQGLTLTPELQEQLAVAENQYKLQMQQMGFQNAEDLAKLAADDLASARNLQIQTKSWTAPLLAWFVVISFAAVVFAILRGYGRVEAAFAGTLVGYLAANANQVVSYYFGSSSGSDRQTELLANK